MCRWLAIGVVIGLGWQLGGCGGGVLSSGTAGSQGGAAGAGGGTIVTGTGGGIAPSGNGGDPYVECARIQAAPRVPPNIVIALDGSRAMGDAPCAGCGLPSRWKSATDGIVATVRDTQADVSWGLDLFGDDSSSCGATEEVDVGVDLGTAQSIEAVLGRYTLGAAGIGSANRPTRNAVAAATWLLQFNSPHRLIVLITAGAPSCAAGSADPISDDTAATVEAIRNAFNAGIGTFVVGLGTFDAATTTSLESMASAGNPGVTGPVPNYFIALSSGDVQTVLRTVVNATEGCTFEIPPRPNALSDPFLLNVRAGDLPIPRDTTHTEGWDYTDSSLQAFQLYGAACAAARANRGELPTVQYVCPAV